MVASAAGVMKACVIRSRSSSSASSSPPYTSGGQITMVAPGPRASSRSSIEVSSRSRSSSAKFDRPAWVTATPFGVPVEPEV
ncbi:Uncharacterised protein [Mycobacteroides abscessus subsp. abscessus]|nr:Uncharacterised protein [Mycobacteroides abscessus subsp. abscessus]